MVQFARGMALAGITTATFDFPYMIDRRKIPDRPPVLEAAWREAIEQARKEFQGLPLFIGGKSMGGRIASHMGAQGCAGLSGLIYLGYPLHPPGKPEQRRDAHLPSIKEPMLFVQGSRDAFGTSTEIAAILPSLRNATLHEVPGGDHSLKVSGKKDMLGEIQRVVAEWIAKWR